jgi:hypothetical protein
VAEAVEVEVPMLDMAIKILGETNNNNNNSGGGWRLILIPD